MIRNELGTNRIQRINWKHMFVLGCVLAVLLLAYPLGSILNDRWVRTSALDQAEVAKKNGDVDLALRHIDRYLASHPEDVPALEFKAKILSEIYLPQPQLIEAAKALDLLIRLDPKGAGRLETRRKLAEFYNRYSDELKRYADTSPDPDLERQQSRYGAAASIASQLVDDSVAGKYDDPVAHRLLARAYEGQISETRGKSLGTMKNPGKKSTEGEAEDLRLKAIQHYKTAIQLDPHDLESSSRLANLYMTWTKDQFAADQVLDEMLVANPKSVSARLFRYRAFSNSARESVSEDEIQKREALARAELEAILVLDPNDVQVRLDVAKVALSRRDPVEAKRHLDAIPAEYQEKLEVKILRGYIEFAEQHPDDAIDQWRRGLLLVGGTDQDLTWKLAFTLTQLGKYVEAEPLRQQYLRLSKGDKNGLGKFLDALFDIGYGRLYEARRKLEKIKDVVGNTYKSDVYITLGRCCDMMGDNDAALQAYRNAASASPGSAPPRLAIARHLQKRNPNGAIEEVDRALAESPKEISLLLESIRLRILSLAARSVVDPKLVRELDELFARLEAIAPTNPTLLTHRSEFLSVTGQLPKAVEWLSQASKGEGRNQPDIWINLAQGLERLNRRNEAIKALDEGALPQNAGDNAKFRIAKARLLGRAGKGQAAREVLTNNPEGVSIGERPELAQARGELLRELGDRDGAIAAYAEWARLSPRIPGPALSLLAMGQVDHDDRASKLGLEALKQIGGDQEPYGIAARVLDLMRTDPNRPGPIPADRLYEAELLVRKLRQDVPTLRFGFLLQGMICEHKNPPDLEGAAQAYKTAQKDDVLSPALPKLIEVLIKLKRFDELARLKGEFDQEVEVRQRPGFSAEFDRIAATVSMRLGDKDRAEYFASKMDERRDNVTARAAFAWMLDQGHEPEKAEEYLRTLVKEKPNDPNGWLTLISFLSIRRTPADVSSAIGQARREYKAERPELFLAQCYWIGKELPNAKEAYKEAVKAKPDDLITLRSLVEFYEQTNQADLMEPVLRKILKLDPSATWAARILAMKLSARPDPATWPEAWALVAPDAAASGDSPEDRLIRATILARSPELRHREEAVPAFISLVNDLPISSPLAVETRYKLALALIDINRFGEAWDAIRPVADDQARPNSPALVLAIEVLARSNQPDEAQRRLDRLTELDRGSPNVPLSMAWVLAAQGKKEEAVRTLESASTMSEKAPNAEAIGLLALDRMIKFGDVETSLRLARKIADRWHADAWELARVHVIRKEHDQALAACEVALGAGSPRDALRYAMAAALNRRDDKAFVRKVGELGEKARTKDPNDFNIHVFLATICHLQDRFEDELSCYRAALELYPSNVQFLNNMAWTLSEGLNKPDEALKCIEEAIQREGEFAQHLDTRGVIEEHLGLLDRAIADLEKSVKVDPNAATYFHLARAYRKANDAAGLRRSRDLAVKAKFNPTTLDVTDRRDVDAVMGGTP